MSLERDVERVACDLGRVYRAVAQTVEQIARSTRMNPKRVRLALAVLEDEDEVRCIDYHLEDTGGALCLVCAEECGEQHVLRDGLDSGMCPGCCASVELPKVRPLNRYYGEI